ncbi:MAG TPA: hypothetical protein DDZ53_11070 [Firmicutes bacterium]|nr:hypothetical protein [Bacillota bacterium]
MKLFPTQGKEARLRRAPDHKSEIIATLPEGAEVEVVEEKGRFLLVHVRDHFQPSMTGYLPTGFVSGYKAVSGQQDKYKPRVGLLPCLRCGGNDWVVHEHATGSGPYLNIPQGLFSYVAVRSRICLDCGYVEPCLDNEGLAKLRKHHGRN